MSLVVDRVSEGGVGPNEVFSAYGPYIVALIAHQRFRPGGKQACKTIRMYKLQIAAAYDLATMSLSMRCATSP